MCSGKPKEKEEREEKVSSLHIDDLADAQEEMGTEMVTEERQTFQITGQVLQTSDLEFNKYLLTRMNKKKKKPFFLLR